ncbi:hypothetical protein BV898_08897 [Hypsibius exemplaris]|uniref:Protein sleepless n=1 Tax=Hypsibius exemplaris TaxID=2072580 RepID=A0A1W0WPA2_HYPEX|nr:hypothetical protein BV898_08897 [Hypsibius exemplaris]
MRRIVLLLGLFLLSVLPFGEGYQCFVCTKGDESCDEPKKEHLQECSSSKGKVSTCIKILTQGVSVRTCGIPGLKVTTCTATGGTTVCVCEREFCNAGFTLPPGRSTAVGSVMAVLFFGRQLLLL